MKRSVKIIILIIILIAICLCLKYFLKPSTAQEASKNNNKADAIENSVTNPSDGIIVTSYPELLSAITTVKENGGGNIYIKGNIIDCSGQILLDAANSNVTISGIENADGTYPVLDFSSFRANYIGKSTNDNQAGIRVTGSNYTIQNVIIQKAPDNGILIKGDSAGNNTFYNCITRYNNDGGLQITGGAFHNTIKFVYSYRNCDIYTLGGNADGFSPKLGAGKGNSFYGCYSWDNSDDGWDSYDKTALTTDLSYEQCACWNNGNPAVFTGQFDFDKGAALDTNLFLVELITTHDSNFASAYANGNFTLPTDSFIVTKSGTYTAANWENNYEGNSNGFKFGSENSTSSCIRTIKNCLSFGHAKKGFDNNNSSCTASFTNCVGFDNGYNYYIAPFTLTGFDHVLSFSGNASNNLPSGCSTDSPDSATQARIRETVTATVNTIATKCRNNCIPGETYFNIY